MTIDLLDPETHFTADAVVRWLTEDGYLVSDVHAFVEGLARSINEAGLQVDRLTIGLPILHPQIAGFQFLWHKGEKVERRQFPANMETRSMLQNSPILANYEGRICHCPIAPEPVDGEFSVLADLRAEGFVDYASFPVPFLDGSFKSLSIATRAPTGYTESEIAELARLIANLAPALEVRSLNYLARSLLDVYVGPTAGGRVLDGEIRRGDGEIIQAVVWFSDLRGSTDLSMSMGGAELIGVINAFFGTVAGSITAHGGEVLKFIGDSVLAIFPCHDIGTMGCAAAASAQAAAHEAMQRMTAYNAEAHDNGHHEIGYGIALHIGEVFYGNVGAEDRLDFTVIGPAVNLASRIEALCRDTGHTLLVSEDYARLSTEAYSPIGSFQLKGIEGWQTVYAPGR